MPYSRLWTPRRRPCSVPVLLLLVPGICLLYHVLMGGWGALSPLPDHHPGTIPAPGVQGLLEGVLEGVRRDGGGTGALIEALDHLERDAQGVRGSGRDRAVVVLGQSGVWDTEVQLYRRVLEQAGYRVSLARYADRSVVLAPQQQGPWSVLVCLRTSEKSCLWTVPFGRLQPHQMVNMIPELVEAFSDVGGGRCRFSTHPRLAGVQLPMMPFACRSTKLKSGPPTEPTQLVSERPPAQTRPPARTSAASAGLRAAVNVYVLVTSAISLTAFLHDHCLTRGEGQLLAHTMQLKVFLNKHLGPAASQVALGHLKEGVAQVLRAALWASPETHQPSRCLLCYQLLTFTLHFTGSLIPTVVKLDRDLNLAGLQDPFDRQITREVILEDTLNFLLPVLRGRSGSCAAGEGACLQEEPRLLLLLQFHRQLRSPAPFHLVCPGGGPDGRLHPRQVHLSDRWRPGEEDASIRALQQRLVQFYDLQQTHANRSGQTSPDSGLKPAEPCTDFHLRQLYTDPPLSLNPPFNPHLRVYRAEVPFHTLGVRVRPQPASAACRVHLDDHRGPSAASYPVGLGDSRINILVLADAAAGAEPVVMTTYTLHLFREGPPSLPLFGDHVMCGFVQDCGLVLQPEKPCGLAPFPGPPDLPNGSLDPPKPCDSGDVPGRWLVPCLSCADNRTCDWREIAWQPDGCYHPVVSPQRLQECVAGRKLLFLGDSTNRGMMYFLMERVNSTLEGWEKAHDTLLYGHLNGGRTHVGYSYYPRFWLQDGARPSFQQALEQLLARSQPLSNSHQTALVVGGVQWLRARHLRTIREVLERESLGSILVVIKSLGIGFHLPAHGIHSLSQPEMQELHLENSKLLEAAKRLNYQVLDTFQITMGRYKDFLPGHCACHFHKVEKRLQALGSTRTKDPRYGAAGVGSTNSSSTSSSSSYHVKGPVNRVYSEILLSRLCPGDSGG